MNVVILDYPSVYFRYHFKMNFMSFNGMQTGGLYGTVNEIRHLHNKFNCPVVICTETRNNKRYSIDKNYKANRAPQSQEFYDLMEEALNFVSRFPFITVLKAEEGEADDAIYSFVKENLNKYNNFFLVASDNDLMQVGALDEKLEGRFFYFKNNGELYDAFRLCREKFNVEPSQLLLYRSILGDKSDNIAPIQKGFLKKWAKYYAENCKTPDDILDREWEEEKYSRILRNNIDQWKINYDLIKLQEVKYEARKFDKKPIDHFVTRYGVKSFYKIIKETGEEKS